MTKSYRQLLAAIRYRACFSLLVAAGLLYPAAVLGQTSSSQDKADSTSADVVKSDSAKPPDPVAQKPSYPGAPSQEPSYPGAPGGKGKLEGTMGLFKVGFYGTLLMNISIADSLELGQEVPIWPIPGDIPISFPDGTTRRAGHIHDTIFTARQTVLGFTLAHAKPSTDAWEPSALLEFDFFGSRPVDSLQPQGRVLNQPRLRLAYFQLEKGMWKIVAGQDKVIIAPLNPVSLSHVAIPLGAAAGNLWGWLPQVRVDATRKFGEKSALFQFGVLRPQFADPRLSDLPAAGTSLDFSSGFGERANNPFYQARAALSWPSGKSTATIGAGGHYGRERVGSQRTLDSWAFALDYDIPLHPRFILRGEGFVGSNLVPFQGGVLQGVGFVAPTIVQGRITQPARFSRIGAGGGWVELTVPATLDYKNILYFGWGTDDPRDKHLLPRTGNSKNSFYWTSYFRKLTDEVTFAFEWANWQFRSRTFSPTGALGPRATMGRGNVFNIALAYQF